MLALHRAQIDREKHKHRGQNDAETYVQLFSDVHLHPSSTGVSRSPHWAGGSKRNSTIPVASSGPGSKRHFFTASSAAPAKRGCPPTSLVFLMSPLGAGVPWIRTTA